MKLHRFVGPRAWFRLVAGLASFALCAMIGCGNTGGCNPRTTPNDNTANVNDNAQVDNCPGLDNPDQADADADGVGDACDNCPAVANPNQIDLDDDGFGNLCDNCEEDANDDQADGDDDAVGDACDNCLTVANTDQADADDDGIGDACADDNDGDGVSDDDDNCPSMDNADQADGDDDTVGDACDNCPDDANADQTNLDGDDDGDVCDNCPNTVNRGQEDGDADGVGDACDNCQTTPNADQADADDDGVGDICDNCVASANADQADRDDDGIADACDNCPGTANADQLDADENGVGDVCENDRDGDGVEDDVDNCPNTDNPGQEDADLDTVGDACDICPNAADLDQANTDTDIIGDACDNCPEVHNTDQADGDDDTVGDLCDNCPDASNAGQADSDGDDVGNICDNCPTVANTDQDDADADGIGDACDNGGGGGPLPDLGADAGADKTVFPCENVTLSATASDASATIAWSGDTSSVGNFTDNGDGTATFAAPILALNIDQTFNFTATASAAGFNNGDDSVAIFLPAFSDTNIATKTSGSAQPGEPVTLSPDVSVPAQIGSAAVWTQDGGDAIQVTLTQVGDGSATFVAPAVAITTDLNFILTTDGCTIQALTGTAMVSIQVAAVTLTLPDTIAEGTSINIKDDFSTLTGAPADAQRLFFAQIPPPNGIDFTLDSETGVLAVTTGAGNTLTITVRVFGTAGELIFAVDTIDIVAAP